MSIIATTCLIGGSAFVAGLLGALTGLGGGIVIVPMLTLALGVDIRYAIGASLVSVIATSSGAAAPYIRQGYTNIRVGMLLEVATTLGAFIGAYVASGLSPNAIAMIFAIVLVFTALQSYQQPAPHVVTSTDPLARRLRLASTFPSPSGPQPYDVQRVPLGFGIMFFAGILSALLGIGSGIVKVLAMDRAMGLPFKVSTTTSTFMIGVTAATSAGVYLHRGYIDPALAFPVMLGVLGGALLGARLLHGAPVRPLRLLFTAVAIALAVQMFYKGLHGSLG